MREQTQSDEAVGRRWFFSIVHRRDQKRCDAKTAVRAAISEDPSGHAAFLRWNGLGATEALEKASAAQKIAALSPFEAGVVGLIQAGISFGRALRIAAGTDRQGEVAYYKKLASGIDPLRDLVTN